MTDVAEIARGSQTPKCLACKKCGKTFKVIPYRYLKGGSRYCSRQCAGTANSATIGRPPTDDEFVAALWPKVDIKKPDECWPWTYVAIGWDGRGIHSFGGRRVLAPRVAYFSKHRRWLEADECACHSCDNPACCNPDHIWAGSNADNIADKKRKGRDLRRFCVRGHSMDGENIATLPSGRRYCLPCSKIRNARRYLEADS